MKFGPISGAPAGGPQGSPVKVTRFRDTLTGDKRCVPCDTMVGRLPEKRDVWLRGVMVAHHLRRADEVADGEEVLLFDQAANNLWYYVTKLADVEEVTDADIVALEREARRAGDLEMASTCTGALQGDDFAREECENVIYDKRGQDV